jgi:hypothetical protein
MKKLLFSIMLLTVSVASIGQGREVDLEAVIYSPEPGYTYYSPSVDSVKYFLVNHGPDTIYQWDFQYTYILIGTSILDPWVAKRFPYPILPGDTLWQSYAMHMNFPITNDSIPLCVHSKAVPERGGDLLREEEGHGDYSNNEHCITVHHVSRTSSTKKMALSADFKVFPNPSHGRISIVTDLDDGTVELLDLSGRVLFTQPVQKVNSLNWHSSGLYFVVVRDAAGYRKAVQKVMFH